MGAVNFPCHWLVISHILVLNMLSHGGCRSSPSLIKAVFQAVKVVKNSFY